MGWGHCSVCSRIPAQPMSRSVSTAVTTVYATPDLSVTSYDTWAKLKKTKGGRRRRRRRRKKKKERKTERERERRRRFSVTTDVVFTEALSLPKHFCRHILFHLFASVLFLFTPPSPPSSPPPFLLLLLLLLLVLLFFITPSAGLEALTGAGCRDAVTMAPVVESITIVAAATVLLVLSGTTVRHELEPLTCRYVPFSTHCVAPAHEPSWPEPCRHNDPLDPPLHSIVP